MTARPQPLRAALAQMNPTVGDVAGNARRIADLIAAARERGAQLVVFPELCLTGYPPEDLLLKTHFLEAARAELEALAAGVEGIVALVGFPDRADDVYNAAAILAEGRVAAVYHKMNLPNYGVFDERRYFQAGGLPAIFECNGVKVGLTVCEDMWEPGPPATSVTLAGAELLVNLSASPYHAGKGAERERMLIQRARDNLAGVLFANAVGGQDELVFDGHSLALDQDGAVVARAPQFEEALVICTVDPGAVAAARLRDPRHRGAVLAARASGGSTVQLLGAFEVPPSGPSKDGGLQSGAVPSGAIVAVPVSGQLGAEEEVYAALRTGLRDYVDKNGFERVVFGLSGGIDSALVALLAVDALGAERVTCVSMPSQYSSRGTRSDAQAIAANLGVELLELPIAGPVQAFDSLLAEAFEGREPDVAEENLQARIRGNIVMALSNKFGWLVLATGNKSELSVGYATLYGDMAGGFAVIKDVYKQWVFRLVRWRNESSGPATGDLVPASVLDRPPSAELRAEQRDEDSLPPYEVLDAILAGYVEGDLDAVDLVASGHPAEEVERVIGMVDRAEYKRRQAPPGIRISTKAFGRDRRLPITSGYETRAELPGRRIGTVEG